MDAGDGDLAHRMTDAWGERPDVAKAMERHIEVRRMFAEGDPQVSEAAAALVNMPELGKGSGKDKDKGAAPAPRLARRPRS